MYLDQRGIASATIMFNKENPMNKSPHDSNKLSQKAYGINHGTMVISDRNPAASTFFKKADVGLDVKSGMGATSK